ncbi:MAG: ribonuclease III [Balneolaceae bacterium]
MFQWLKRTFGTSTEETIQHEPEKHDKWTHLESILGFSVKENHKIFEQALRHRSLTDGEQYEKYETYERLEFLGDAVLDLIVTEIIYEHYPTKNEGFLTKLRSKLVRGNSLAHLAHKLELYRVLEIGSRARGQGIEKSKSVLSDIFESLVAAIYLTQGYEMTYEFVESVFLEYIDFDEITAKVDNYKSLLLELTQANKLPLPQYRVLSEQGPGHDKTFDVSVSVDNVDYGRGEGKSKKEAEQLAAKIAYQELNRQYE